MSSKTNLLSVPDIEKTLNRIPMEMSEKEKDLLCSAMTLVLTGDSKDKDEMEMLTAQATEMTRLLHQCMHLGPRVCGLVALNCLVSLEMVLTRAVPDMTERLSIHSALVAHAVQIAAAHEDGQISASQTKH